MDFNWSDIFQDFLDSKMRKCSEREFQNIIFSVFRYCLYWKNNIVAEESIPIGATNTIRPDFVLYKDDTPQVVIESKEPNHNISERNKEQLFSYMRQKKVDFGLYIGEVIQLYYDVPTDAELPILIFTLEYDENSMYGPSFVKLFNYQDFDRNQLADFCLSRIQEIQKRHRIDNDIKMLTSDEGSNLCVDLLKSHFLSIGYTEADSDSIFNDIEIVIRRKNNDVQAEPRTSFIQTNSEVNKAKNAPSQRRQKYMINRQGSYYKNAAALGLVRLYLQEHPSTYRKIESIFNTQVPNYVLSKEEVERKEERSYDRNKTKRWHKDFPLVSSDGITFYVTTQVGDGCPIDFKDIVSLSDRLGYKIEPII